jgi:integrase/recombinase XerD
MDLREGGFSSLAKPRTAVAGTCAMRDLRKDLRHYIDLRRALGYRLRKIHRISRSEGYRSDHHETGSRLATESSKGHKHSCFERLGFIQCFPKHVSSMDARTELPPTGTMRRPEVALRPYIYTQEEISRLMAAARKLFSPRGLRCHTYYHLVGLLATTGMRSGEAVRLADRDVNLAEGLLTIRESKFGKSRIVPLHPTTVKALAGYKARRDAFLKKAEAPTFFINERGGPITAAPTRASAISVARRGWRRCAMDSVPGCTI